MKRYIWLILFAGLGVAVHAQTVAPLPFKLETGVNYSRGDYGLSQDTEVFAVPVSLSYEYSDWTFRASLPWLNIKGPASVIEGGGIPVRPTANSESGFGDLTGSLTYKFLHPADGPAVSLTGRVKFPTGSESRGLSTGETDYYAQVDVLQSFGKVTPFATAGYRWLGTNSTFQLKNGAYVSGGFAVQVADGTSVGGAYEWRQKIVNSGDDASEVSVFVFHKIDEHWSISLTALKGFTDASPNWGLNASVAYAF